MKIFVAGLWHLGVVYSACLADKGNEILAFDESKEVINQLSSGNSPIEETGIDNLILKNINSRRLSFTHDDSQVVDSEAIWITADTPVNDHDVADVMPVMNLIEKLLRLTPPNVPLIVSSQLPAGSMQILLDKSRDIDSSEERVVIYAPENLRLGIAIESFKNQDPWIAGSNHIKAAEILLTKILEVEVKNLIITDLVTAEFVKHTINGFLALSVSFANEIGEIASNKGADANLVMKAVMTDPRIGPKAYLKPGKPIEGGTLARDVNFLNSFTPNSSKHQVLEAILPSNHARKRFIINKIISSARLLQVSNIGIIGLGYKKGSSTLRRSFGIEILQELNEAGFTISVYDDFPIDNVPIENIKVVDSKQVLISENKFVVWNSPDALNIQDYAEFKTTFIDTSNPYKLRESSEG